MARTFKTPNAFKASVEQRLKAEAKTGRDLGRLRQLLVFDRFIARLIDEFGDAIVLKGGLALELRLQRARTTKDIDIGASGDPKQMLDRFQRAGRLDLHDFMVFEVRRHKYPTILTERAKYEGLRFRVECKIAGKIYGNAFPMDIGIGDPMLGDPEEVVAPDRLRFAGIAPPRVRVYPIESHLAEKLHAYTMKWPNGNSRDKDLPDIALIANETPIRADRLRKAIAKTFAFRDTHPIPDRLPAPPVSWQGPYAEKALEFELPWKTLDECHARAQRFFDPVLGGLPVVTWDPEAWDWSAHAESS
ncbi:MAG: nucleotidyl transferase AbiEii/AbiGii toxin family protein [Myxococcota bacterium]